METSGFNTYRDKYMSVNTDLVTKIEQLNLANRNNYKDPENPSDLGDTPDWKIAELLNAANISVSAVSYNVVPSQTVSDKLSLFLTEGSVDNYLTDITIAAATSPVEVVRKTAQTAQNFLALASQFDFNEPNVRSRAATIIAALDQTGLIDPTTAADLLALGVNSNPTFISWIENYNLQPENANQQIQNPIDSQTVGVARGGFTSNFSE